MQVIISDVFYKYFCWHMDVNDKLKPYGFSIHGCVDELLEQQNILLKTGGHYGHTYANKCHEQ